MTPLGEAIRFSATTPNVNTKSGTYAQALPVGTVVVVAVDAPVTAAWTTPTFTDSAGNTYTLRHEQHGAPVNYQLAVFTSTLTTAVTTSTSWTATVTGANPAKWAIQGAAFSDTNGYAMTTAGSTGASTSPTTGVSATASQNKQVVVGVYAWTDSGLTTNLTVTGATALTKVSATDRSLALAYQTVDAAGTRSQTGTLTASQGWAGVGVILNDVVPVSQTVRVWDGTTLRPATIQAWA